MGKTLVIAEKPSVGKDYAKALPGSFKAESDYLESDRFVVAGAVGHLVQLAEAGGPPGRAGRAGGLRPQVQAVVAEPAADHPRRVPPEADRGPRQEAAGRAAQAGQAQGRGRGRERL